MNAAELTKIYVEIGALGLGFVVLIGMFIFFVKNQIKNSNKQTELIEKLVEKKDEQNTELIKQFINQVANHTPSPQEAKEANRQSETIDTQLNQLLKDTEASRAVLIQYHNGTRGFSKHSFMKMTCTNEAHLSNVKPLMPVFHDQMKSLFNKALTILDEVGEYSVESLDKIKEEDESMYWFMSERNDRQAFHLSIRDKYDNPIGYLLVIYSNNNPVIHSKEEILSKMKITRTLIEYILQSNQEE